MLVVCQMKTPASIRRAMRFHREQLSQQFGSLRSSRSAYNLYNFHPQVIAFSVLRPIPRSCRPPSRCALGSSRRGPWALSAPAARACYCASTAPLRKSLHEGQSFGKALAKGILTASGESGELIFRCFTGNVGDSECAADFGIQSSIPMKPLIQLEG